MQQLRAVTTRFADQLAHRTLVLCCKGIELSTGLRASQVLAQTLPEATLAVLTGPSFAADIARGLPTALTLACETADCAEELQEQLQAPHLRLYRTTDVTGAELGGAMKNVIAIACGAAIGAGLGDSAPRRADDPGVRRNVSHGQGVRRLSRDAGGAVGLR